MPAPLLEFLLQLATDAERAAIEEALAERVWSGPDQPTPNPATERRLRPRTQAERAFAAILARVLAQPRRPHATALDQTARRIEFGLETLRGCEHDVDWPTSTLNMPPRGHLPALYRTAIKVEEDRATPTATADLEAIALELAAKHSERGQESLQTLYHSQKPAVRIPKKPFPKKPGLGRKPRR